MNKLIHTLLVLLLGFTAAFAQGSPDPNTPQGENMQVPESWEVRLDRPNEEVVIGATPDSSDIYFVNMTPGWHITTGPAGIFYHPSNTASGNFTLKTDLHYFDPGERNREAYGLFWGGSNLKADNQEYVYFLVRNTGEFLIKKRVGEETETIQGWTTSEAIAMYTDEVESSSVLNILAVSVGQDEITFHINDEEVASVATEEINSNGVFGLRVNHSINIHVSDLSITE